ncbi:MAG TPA: TIGR00153 family protein [Phycisphaerae bacterium]|nr:TIGR00153 family protein [Phycisphaerae bacterium]
MSMLDRVSIFGRSPFGPLAEHARKVHECVSMIPPVAEAILAGDTEKISHLQHEISKTEYEADLLKDQVRQNLPKRYFLPVRREEVAGFLSEMDKIADAAEDFAVTATLRKLDLPEELHREFLDLVAKVLQVSESLLSVAEHLAELQKECFVGAEADDVLAKIQQICHMEWESDKLNRRIARHAYGMLDLDPVKLMLLERLCRALSRLADHAENVGKNLRLMITRK